MWSLVCLFLWMSHHKIDSSNGNIHSYRFRYLKFHHTYLLPRTLFTTLFKRCVINGQINHKVIWFFFEKRVISENKQNKSATTHPCFTDIEMQHNCYIFNSNISYQNSLYRRWFYVNTKLNPASNSLSMFR